MHTQRRRQKGSWQFASHTGICGFSGEEALPSLSDWCVYCRSSKDSDIQCFPGLQEGPSSAANPRYQSALGSGDWCGMAFSPGGYWPQGPAGLTWGGDWHFTLITDFGRQVASGSTVLAQEGDSLHLFCLADSNPPTNIEWVKGCRTSGKCCLSPDNWLQLTSVRVEDAGDYACQAKNTIGSALGMIQLQVVCEWVRIIEQLTIPKVGWRREGVKKGW